MNLSDAVELATKFGKTWRGGPHPDVWAEELEPLHTNQARHAYERLRRSEDSAPSIARFMAVYHSLSEGDEGARGDCVRCDGGGWVERTPVEHTAHCANLPGCHCSSVIPCDCPAGRQAHATFTKITSHRKDVPAA